MKIEKNTFYIWHELKVRHTMAKEFCSLAIGWEFEYDSHKVLECVCKCIYIVKPVLGIKETSYISRKFR